MSRYNQPTELGKAIYVEIPGSEVFNIFVVFRTIWSFKETDRRDPHLYPIKSVVIGLNSKVLVSGDEKGVVKIWGMEYGEKRCKIKPSLKSINSLAFSPDSQIIVIGSHDGKIKFFKVENENLEEIGSIAVNSSVNSLAFSPSGKILASGSDDSNIRIWRVNKNELIATLNEHKSGVTSVSFSADGLLASGSKDGTIKVWREGW